MKTSKSSPWAVFEQTPSLRVQALDSFPIPSDQGLGPGHSLLVTQAIVAGQSRIQWLLDGAKSFSLRNSSFSRRAPTSVPSVRTRRAGCGPSTPAFARRGSCRESGHRLAAPWCSTPSPSSRLLRQDLRVRSRRRSRASRTVPEPSTRPSTRPCIDATTALCPRVFPRWVPVYRAPPVGPHNSGLRGGRRFLTHDGSSSLLISTEGSGNVYRFDDLPRGQLDTTAQPNPRSGADGLVRTLEFQPVPAIRQMLASQGTIVPATGHGSIVYVIAAYNNADFRSIKIGGVSRQLFGFEWGYQGLPAQRRRSADPSPRAWCTSTPAPASPPAPIRGSR